MLLNEVLQMSEKTWTPDANPVIATLTTVGQSRQGKFGYEQPIQIKDESGISANVKVQTKYEAGLMPQYAVGRKLRWRLKWFTANGKKNLAGYCLDKIEAPTQHQEQCQQLQDAIDDRASGAKQRDYDAENRGKCRHGIICAGVTGGQIQLGDNLKSQVESILWWTEVAMTGAAPLPPQKSGVLNEDVPWEIS